MKSNEAVFQQAVQWLGSANRVMVFTGAGVSAESGIPTFRDQLTGLWAKFDPAQLATPDAFRNDPGLVWGWYEWRRALAAAAKPNPAHIAIAALARYVPELVVVTQNVDDLHERAGSEHVVHLHGNLQAARCFACARPHSLPACASSALTQSYVEPPRCAHCNGRVRPGVVWFGEALPEAELGLAFARSQECDVLLSVGTSGNVYPAAGIPEIALRHGGRVVHINTEVVDMAGAVTLQGLAGEWMGRLVDATFGGRG